MTAARKRSWAQQVLGGASVAQKNLFVDGAFDDVSGDAEKGVREVLACRAIEQGAGIKNTTCVLGELLILSAYLTVVSLYQACSG